MFNTCSLCQFVTPYKKIWVHVMKKSILSFMIYALFVLPSCAPYTESAGKIDKRNDMTSLPNNYSLLDLGRTLSQGSVDIFDPWLTVFSLPTDIAPEKDVGLLTFPEHPTMLVRDNRVSVYTLRDSNSPAYNEFFNVMENNILDVPAAVPLIEGEPL